jgi:predicted dehydrogenase
MRIAYAGLGWATHAFHLPALGGIPGAELVGGCDLSAERRREWEAKSRTPSFEGLDELIDAAVPELVVVATPPASHAELCVEALRAGTHVFCEKPFVSSLEEADRVIAAAEEADRRVAVNHEFREKPVFRAVRERIGAADVGELVFCQIWQLMDLAPWDEPVAWRREMPNRTLFEGGVHLVDLLITIFGEPPQAVYARHSSGVEDRDADAVHLVTLEFPGGRLAQLTIDRLCRAGTRYVELRADCEQTSLRASLGGRAALQVGKRRAERAGIRLDLASGGLAWEERGLKRRTLARNPRQAGMHATGELLKRVVAALEQGSEPPSCAREAREVLRVIEAAYESARTGRRVELIPGTARLPNGSSPRGPARSAAPVG